MIWMARNFETDRHIPNRSRRRCCAIYRSSFVDDFGHWICLEQSSRRSGGQSCVRVDGLFHFGGRRMERVGSVWRHVYVCQQNGSQNSVVLESDHLPKNFNFLASIQLKTVNCLIAFIFYRKYKNVKCLFANVLYLFIFAVFNWSCNSNCNIDNNAVFQFP